MPFPADTKYPAVATNAAWQKKKSLLDKGIKTNVGPALVLAEKKWKLIEFEDLNDKKIGKTPGAAEDNLKKATEAWKAVAPARAALKDAWEIAEPQSNNNKLNSASRTALKAIVKALKEAEHRLDIMDDVLRSFMVDVSDTKAKALSKLTNLEVKAGSKVIASAKEAKLTSDKKSYEVTGVDWKIDTRVAMDNLQKKVSVSAHDSFGHRFEKDMILAGIKGSDEMRLK